MTLTAWAALLVVYLVWGSTYLAIKVAIETLPVLLHGGVRFLTAGTILLVVLAVARPRSLAMTARQFGTAALAGILLLLGGNGMVAVAEQRVSSGLAALLVAATPLWIVVLRFAFRDPPPRLTLLGVVVGFVGVAVLLLPGGGPAGGDAGHAALVVFAALSWAVGSYLTTRRPMPASPFAATAVEMLVGGAAMAALGLALGEGRGFHLAAVSGRSWAALAYLVVFGSLAAFTAYVWLLGNAPVSTVSTYAYVNPAVAVLLGALILGERLTAPVIVGGLVILAAVAIVVTAESRRARADRRGLAGEDPGSPA